MPRSILFQALVPAFCLLANSGNSALLRGGSPIPYYVFACVYFFRNSSDSQLSTGSSLSLFRLCSALHLELPCSFHILNAKKKTAVFRFSGKKPFPGFLRKTRALQHICFPSRLSESRVTLSNISRCKLFSFGNQLHEV